MDNQLKEVARAYRAALDEESEAKDALAKAKERRDAAGQNVAKARDPLAKAIVIAARDGVRQKDILEEIENVYTRETVRRICRAAGVEPTE